MLTSEKRLVFANLITGRQKQKIQIIYFRINQLIIICQIRAQLIILLLSAMKNQPTQISINYLAKAYKDRQASVGTNPILQILGYQINPHQPNSEIIVRLSDEVTFVDCILSGNFTLQNNKIIQCSTSKGIVEYRNHNLVKLINFTIKIDAKKICRFRLIIHDMDIVAQSQIRFGTPAQLIQYIENSNMNDHQSIYTDLNNNDKSNQKLKLKKIQEGTLISNQQIIKIEDQQRQCEEQEKQNNHNNNEEDNDYSNNKGIAIKKIISQSHQPLTNKQILAGKEGYFIGRLLRLKMTSKETKQGSMSVLIAGFLDYTGQLVRINMAGRTAIKQFKQLKKKKCYYLRGIQMYQTQKMLYPQIRIRQKQFKISQINIPKVLQLFKTSYYHWDHQLNSIQSERVDVIGIIDDIEDKVAYNNTGSNQTRQVVRIVVRNICKSVKISFWAEQINVFKTLKIRKRQPVILQDIRKKKNLFLDFTYESSIIKLDEQIQTKNQLAHFIPQPQQSKLPINIGQMYKYFEQQEQGAKTISLNVYLRQIQTHRIIYKLCAQCKRKVQQNSLSCQSCQSNNFQYKFNCQVQFCDGHGSFNSILFQGPANKILNKNAKQISQLKEEELNDIVKQLQYKQYEVSIQNKNLRFILRNVRILDESQFLKMSEQNIKQINQRLLKKRQ